MNSLCTAIERDILECLSGSVTTHDTTSVQTPLLQSFTSPLVGLASVRYDILLATASRYSPSAAEGQLIGRGGFPPRRSSHPAHPAILPTQPLLRVFGYQLSKGLPGADRTGAWSLHLVIFSTHSYAFFFFGPNPLFPFFQCFRDMGRLVRLSISDLLSVGSVTSTSCTIDQAIKRSCMVSWPGCEV
jgi:hypothetical protein